MKILKRGIYPKIKTCSTCSCVFEYDATDIERHKFPVWIPELDMFCEANEDVIKCPGCGTYFTFRNYE